MTRMLFLFLIISSFSSHAMIESQLLTRPNQNYMNFFLDSYLEWHEKTYDWRPNLNDKKGNDFLNKAIKSLNHWRTPEIPQMDQILVGQGFDEEGKPFYNFRVYIDKTLREDPYLKSYKLPFKPLFIERTKKDGLCFLAEINLSDITWESVPRSQDSRYLQHFCSGNLEYISYISKQEAAIFKNPFTNQADYEIQTYKKEKLVSIFQYVKTTHTAFLLPQHISYVNAHGVAALVPFDKFSLNEKGEMVIYYP